MSWWIETCWYFFLLHPSDLGCQGLCQRGQESKSRQNGRLLTEIGAILRQLRRRRTICLQSSGWIKKVSCSAAVLMEWSFLKLWTMKINSSDVPSSGSRLEAGERCWLIAAAVHIWIEDASNLLCQNEKAIQFNVCCSTFTASSNTLHTENKHISEMHSPSQPKNPATFLLPPRWFWPFSTVSSVLLAPYIPGLARLEIRETTTQVLLSHFSLSHRECSGHAGRNLPKATDDTTS